MLQGVNRVVDLIGPRATDLADEDRIRDAVGTGNIDYLSGTTGHFAALEKSGQTVRLARTIGLPLRYFIAKMFHGPFLVASDRIDRLYDWCREQRIGWQFDPLYTRMVPAHYLMEIEQIGCPDPNPRYTRFFDPPLGDGPADLDELGNAYVGAAYGELLAWLRARPVEPLAVLFSGGVDSGSMLMLADRALRELGRDPGLLRAFTLDLGGGADVIQAERFVQEVGLADRWEPLRLEGVDPDLQEAIAVIEDYHPLDVECAAAALLALGEIRARYPEIRLLVDGDGGDENLKAYPLEDSDLTISSVMRNPLLYQEGWGIDAIKHSLTYSGGLSRSYVRTYAPAERHGFDAFSPFTTRAAIAASLRVPFERLLAGDASRLHSLKGDVVRAGMQTFAGVELPVFPKRRFQDGVAGAGEQGAGTEAYRRWRVGKGWCRQVFLRQWEDRLRESWDGPDERRSGNEAPASPSQAIRPAR